MNPHADRSAVTYTRDPKTRDLALPYTQKFAGFIKLCDEARAKGATSILVSWPWVLGDNYEELVESLARIADAHLALHIVERSPSAGTSTALN